MSYVPSVNQAHPSEFQQPDGCYTSVCNVPPQHMLFTVPPPPVPAVPEVGLARWWVGDQARQGGVRAHETCGSQLQVFDHVPVEELKVPRDSAPEEPLLSSWLARRQRPATTTCRSPGPAVKIFEASECFKTVLKLMQELQELYDNLENNCTILPCEEWSGKWKEITEKQTKVTMCLNKISSPDTIRKLKFALLKRKKKRFAQKNARAHQRKEKIEFADKVRQLHKKIDTWLEDMQESVERSKREESLKVEADQVLSEVTRKKAEARRQLSLLSSLLKLRQLRARTWASRGENVSAELGVQFNRVIDSLRKVWEDQLQVYSVEERGLKVMLEGVVEERNKKQDKREREIIRQWEQLLFGNKSHHLHEHNATNAFFSAAERDVEAFVLIRGQWDKFLVPPGAPMSSSIPLGWVLPAGPSSQEWANLLQKENKNVN